MTQEKVFEALDKLGSFTVAEKKKIASRGRLITIPVNWAPIAQSMIPDKVYLIVEGQAVVRKDSQEIATLETGDLMGEIGMTKRRPRTATVVAKSPMTVLHFTPANWRNIREEIPSLALSVENIIAKRS